METDSNTLYSIHYSVDNEYNLETLKITEKEFKKPSKTLLNTTRKKESNSLTGKLIAKMTAKASNNKKETGDENQNILKDITKRRKLSTIETALLGILKL